MLHAVKSVYSKTNISTYPSKLYISIASTADKCGPDDVMFNYSNYHGITPTFALLSFWSVCLLSLQRFYSLNVCRRIVTSFPLLRLKRVEVPLNQLETHGNLGKANIFIPLQEMQKKKASAFAFQEHLCAGDILCDFPFVLSQQIRCIHNR